MPETDGAGPLGLRPTMAGLISKLRTLIGDQGNPPTFSDAELEGFLDETRSRESYSLLTGDVIKGTGADPDTYAVFSGQRFFESGATLYNHDDLELTPGIDYTADELNGVWTLTTPTTEYVTVTGWRYDPYMAGARALRVWASKVKLHYDVAVAGDSFSRSQKISQLLTMAGELEAMSESGGALQGGVGAVNQSRTDWRP